MTGDLPQINRARSGGNPGARTPASHRRQETARAVAELLRITRVLERVCELSWDKLDGAARLAAADARQRLVDFCEKHDTEKRKR
jgi:hypothetical protein